MPWTDGCSGGGTAATNTNNVEVSGSYVPIPDAIVLPGTSTTIALGALQGQINTEMNEANAVKVTTDENVDYITLKTSTSVSYVNTGSSIITLTLVNGGFFMNPPVLNGSSTTAGINPGELITFTKQPDYSILCS